MSRPKWPRSVWRFWTRSATRATAWAARKFSHSTWSTFTCAESKTAARLLSPASSSAHISNRNPAAAPRRTAKLIVVEGQANAEEIALSKARTNIGRTVDVYRSEGLIRRNDLAFTEDTEINRTVSREHAHIVHDRAAGEYRLFNDRWYERDKGGAPACGTWIVRDGLSQEVHRTARGTKLESGDEIHFGKAVARFQLK